MATISQSFSGIGSGPHGNCNGARSADLGFCCVRVTVELPAHAMVKEYARKLEGVYRVADTRVSLDSVVYLFREGLSAEGIAESYPALTLEQVHGETRLRSALTFPKETAYLRSSTGNRGGRTSNSLRSCNEPGVRIRFQADADLDGRIVRGLRRAVVQLTSERPSMLAWPV